MLRELPSGTVTFVFTDVEGSTRLLNELGPHGYAAALADHRRIIRDAAARHGGVEVDNQGDAFFFAFPTAPGALAAAEAFSAGLAGGPIRVRTGIHTGTPHLTDEGYVGADVHRASRIAAAGHGGQLLVSAATASLLGMSGLRDLGDHRLKDLPEPERILQLGDEAFPPLKTLHQTNLPVPTTPFLGRETAIAEIERLLRDADVRVVTLTGPGGTGKTRLAIQAASAAGDAFPGGVWWVPLAPLTDHEVVLPTAAKIVGARGDLAEHIGASCMLLVLDNFEQVIGAAPAVGQLLERCPNLRALVTSREPLRLRGEWEYPVDPLTDAEARSLFDSRARAMGPDVSTSPAVAEICRLLDNLPLAIELAAARVKLLSPEALLARLDQRLPVLTGGARDAPDRHRTLRATIAWSHDLLTPHEQRLFAAVAVFRGGWTLDAAEGVVEADLDTLQSLLEKSLIRQRNDRFWMLETIREFALEALERSGKTSQVADRHAAWFLALAEEAKPDLERGAPAWLDRLELERDNLRATLDHLAASGRTQDVLRLAESLLTFWTMHGHLTEGRRRLEQALAAEATPTRMQGNAQLAAAVLADQTGDPVASERYARDALALFEELQDPAGMARARYSLANLVAGSGDWAAARDLFARSVAEFEAVGDDFHRLAASRGLAWMHEELGEYDRYLEMTRENLRLARELGNRRIEARSLGALAMASLDARDVDEARRLLTDSFSIDRALGFQTFIAIDLHRFAAILVREGAAADAAVLVGRGDALIEQIGLTLESWMREERADTVARILEGLDEAEVESAMAGGRAMTTEAAAELAVRDRSRSGQAG